MMTIYSVCILDGDRYKTYDVAASKYMADRIAAEAREKGYVADVLVDVLWSL